MQKCLSALICATLAVVPVAAKPFEVGLRMGLLSSLHSPDNEDISTYVGLPIGESVYALWFPDKHSSFGPYLSFSSHFGGATFWSGEIGSLLSYYPQGNAQSGYHLTGKMGVQFYDAKREDFMAGVGLSYQIIKRLPFVWRVRVDYTRWLENKYNDVSVGFTLAVRR